VRARELRTLDLLGAPRGFVARLVLLELGLVLALGAVLAGAGAALVGALVPDLVTLL
jgi:cell division protein FtsX